MISIVIFLPEFRKNSNFADRLFNTFPSDQFSMDVVYVNKKVNPLQQQQFLYAVHVSDIVIIDCTRSDDCTDGGVYTALTAQINCLNHILVISENVLPLNIKPYRVIAPIEDNQTLSPSYIIEKLPKIVEQSIKEDTYHRLPAEEFLSNMERFMPDMERMIRTSLDARYKKKEASTNVMISYRNSHKKEVDNFVRIMESNDIKNINLRKKMGCPGNYQIKLLPPASLCGADEAHTPMRRWMLVGILEDHIREMDEVWVYESRDSDGNIDYTNSWWTIAEMVMVSYINSYSSKLIKIRAFNPVEKRFYDTTPDKYLITLTETQTQKLARLLSNTRPDTMGPENLEQVRQLSQVAEFLRSEAIPETFKQQMLENLKSSIEASIPQDLSDEDRKQMFESMMNLYSDPAEIDKYVKDDIFQESFWNDISYQTIRVTPCFNGTHIDTDTFLSLPMQELTDRHIADFESASRSRNRTIQLNNKTYTVERANADRYLWLATRMGKPTIGEISGTPGLEIIPIYNLSPVESNNNYGKSNINLV